MVKESRAAANSLPVPDHKEPVRLQTCLLVVSLLGQAHTGCIMGPVLMLVLQEDEEEARGRLFESKSDIQKAKQSKRNKNTAYSIGQDLAGMPFPRLLPALAAMPYLPEVVSLPPTCRA